MQDAMKILISEEGILLCMNLFILRHGKAEKSSDDTPDAARALTRDGKEEVKKVAQWMKKNKFRFDTIATSPLKRARGTAKIVAAVLDQKDGSLSGMNLHPAAILIRSATTLQAIVNMHRSFSSGMNPGYPCLSVKSR